MLLKAHRLIVPPPFDAERATAAALVDWQRDSRVVLGAANNGPGGGIVGRAIDRDAFFTAVFELADAWSESTDAAECVAVGSYIRIQIRCRHPLRCVLSFCVPKKPTPDTVTIFVGLKAYDVVTSSLACVCVRALPRPL